MSLPEWLLDDESGECPECGRYTGHDGTLCYQCKMDLVDTNADLAYERMIERYEQ